MKKKPLILDVKGNSLDDGPGIRSVVFIKGCPLSCSWCHNPESKKAIAEISFDPNQCVRCNTCLETCSLKALSRENPFFIDRTLCNLCFDCVESCPSGALEKVGKEINIPELVEMVGKDKPFFDTSGGGVTLSGGEPTLRMEYLAEASQALKEKGVHVLVETCGQFDYEAFINLVYPHTDMIYFDIKLIDEQEHKKYCGLSNKTILENFRKLQQRYLEGGVDLLPRTPLIPGITDTKENLTSIVKLYKETKVEKTQLMAYHPLWTEKNLKIGVKSPENLNKKLGEWLSSEQTKNCEKIFTDAGLVFHK
jgi:pyruvate formate lyase activating enzyme